MKREHVDMQDCVRDERACVLRATLSSPGLDGPGSAGCSCWFFCAVRACARRGLHEGSSRGDSRVRSHAGTVWAFGLIREGCCSPAQTLSCEVVFVGRENGQGMDKSKEQSTFGHGGGAGGAGRLPRSREIEDRKVASLCLG